jgi:hypothetical protein
MNQGFPCMYGPIYHGTILFLFFRKIFEEVGSAARAPLK